MSGTFGGDFNLAGLVLTTKLKSPSILCFISSLNSIIMNELIRQSIFLPKSPNLINVRQMYHSSSIKFCYYNLEL